MIDPRAIISLAGVLFCPDDLVELRSIGSGSRSRTVLSSDLDLPSTIKWITTQNRMDRGVYYGPNPRMSLRGSGYGGSHTDNDVQLARSCFVDFDDAAPTEAIARIRAAGFPDPSIVIASGRSTGTHAYWILREPTSDLGAWRLAQMGLIQVLGSDPVVKNPSRMMRLPGTHNTKHDAPCVLIRSDGLNIGSLDDLGFDLAPPKKTLPVESRATNDDTPTYRAETGAGDWSNLTQRTNGYFIIPTPEGERNSKLFAVACDMAANGFTRENAGAKLIPLAVGRDGLDEQEAQITISKAFGKPRTTKKIPFDASKMANELNRIKPLGCAIGRILAHGGEA